MYLLDTNVFVTPKQTYYGFDLVPGFWVSLITAHANLTVHFVRAVYLELQGYIDELSEWAKVTAPRSLFVEPDEQTVAAIAAIVEWAKAQTFTEPAQREFQASADLELIATAYAMGKTVVTLETSSPESKKSIKIPDVCRAFNIKYTDPFTMLRQLGVSFT
jgi:hypothetical protein